MKSFALILLLLMSSETIAAGPDVGATSSATIGIQVTVPPRFSARFDDQSRVLCIQSNYSAASRVATVSGEEIPDCFSGAANIASSRTDGLLLITPE